MAIKPKVSQKWWEKPPNYIREINRDALRGETHTVEDMMRNHQQIRDFFASGRAADLEEYGKEIDRKRNAIVRAYLTSELKPYTEGLTQDDLESLRDDLSRLELEVRYGGEEQYGGYYCSSDAQLKSLKKKMAALRQRNQTRGDEDGSD